MTIQNYMANSCWDISLWTTVVDWPINIAIPRDTLLGWLKTNVNYIFQMKLKHFWISNCSNPLQSNSQHHFSVLKITTSLALACGINWVKINLNETADICAFPIVTCENVLFEKGLYTCMRSADNCTAMHRYYSSSLTELQQIHKGE